MPTPRTSSSTVTSPLPSQSPVHESAGGSVGLGVADGVGLGESITVDVGSGGDPLDVGLGEPIMVDVGLADVVAVGGGPSIGGVKVGVAVVAVAVITALAVVVGL
jgi:hypothetical protein